MWEDLGGCFVGYDCTTVYLESLLILASVLKLDSSLHSVLEIEILVAVSDFSVIVLVEELISNKLPVVVSLSSLLDEQEMVTFMVVFWYINFALNYRCANHLLSCFIFDWEFLDEVLVEVHQFLGLF